MANCNFAFYMYKQIIVPAVFVVMIITISSLATIYEWGKFSQSEFIGFVSGFTSFYYVNYMLFVKWSVNNPFKEYRAFVLFDISVFKLLVKEMLFFISSRNSILLYTTSLAFFSIFNDASPWLIFICLTGHYTFSILLVMFLRLTLASKDWNYFVGFTLMISWLSILNTYLLNNKYTLALANYNILNTIFYLPILGGVFNALLPVVIYVTFWLVTYCYSSRINLAWGEPTFNISVAFNKIDNQATLSAFIHCVPNHKLSFYFFLGWKFRNDRFRVRINNSIKGLLHRLQRNGYCFFDFWL